MTEHDPVNHPTHYASEAKCSGCGEPIECIDVVRHLSFNIGNAIKYMWRAGKKDDLIQDLKKADWYINDQIAMLEGVKNPAVHRLSETTPQSFTKNQVVADIMSSEETEKGLEVKVRIRPCEYTFVDGDYLCFIHSRGSDRHPREGVNRPCRFVTETEVITHQEGG